MDVGDTSTFGDSNYWKTQDNHMGFDIAANLVDKQVDKYLSNLLKNNPEYSSLTPIYWITGHSRGGAVANTLAAYYINEGMNVYAYTYAAPTTTEANNAKDSKYDCIFNIINTDDFITYFPCWGFQRYGQDKKVSMSGNSSRKNDWEKISKMDYLYMVDPTAPLKELEIATKFGNDFGSRDNCYKINYEQPITFTLEEFGSYPSNASGYYVRKDGKVYQSPMFLMMYFAAVASGDRTGMQFFELNVAGYLESTKWEFLSQITGISDGKFDSFRISQKRIERPHMQYTYILLARSFDS